MHIERSGGSFRDPAGQVYQSVDGRILRALNEGAAAVCREVFAAPFFQRRMAAGDICSTVFIDDSDIPPSLQADSWAAVIEHEALSFVSYPYEWTFSMLRDAALLQLELQEEALAAGWTYKDATPYNIQWRGSKPVFIDIPSVVAAEPGEPWVAYRQFCMLFLYPLMLKAHLGISFNALLRAELDGVSPVEMNRYFGGWRRFAAGVPSHVWLPAMVENALARRQRGDVAVRKKTPKPQSAAMIAGLVRGLQQTTRKLTVPLKTSDWSDYAESNSYAAAEMEEKKDFVRRHATARCRRLVWDLGANTGVFSKICADTADMVVAVDGDAEAVERLYLEEKKSGNGRILPLVMNLANISPMQGWGGYERAAFDRRQKPELVLALALLHHLRIAANIPLPLLLDWLASLAAEAIIEFVDRDDAMTQKLLQNKTERYEDYNLAFFESELVKRFVIIDAKRLKGGARKIYYLQRR